MRAQLEHVNVTVANSRRAAGILVKLFGWKIRWEGPSQSGGHSVHVGSDASYLALYTPPASVGDRKAPGRVRGGLNHIALVVDDLEKAESRILDAGYKTFNHGDYEPGRRFYFYDDDEIEYEIVSYAPKFSSMELASLTK